MIATPALSAESLRFVRCEKSLNRAIAQHKHSEFVLARREAQAASGDAMAAKMVEGARETACAWFLRVAELFEAATPTPAPVVEVEVAPVAPVATPAQSAPVRDASDVCRVKAWRRFMAIAKGMGLDCQARERMTIALAKFLGVVIPSRSLLSAGQICEAAAAVEMGVLAW